MSFTPPGNLLLGAPYTEGSSRYKLFIWINKKKVFPKARAFILNVFQSQSNLVEDQKIRNTYVQYQTLVSVYEQ